MMNQYDFLNLSYVEFEELCRDLLQKTLQIRLESFAEGADGGIDLRYLHANGQALVVQCKRYGDFQDLIKTLKKELPKLRKLQPKEYLVATSVSLTAAQKDKIVALLHPYLATPAAIYGKKDLNALLRQYPDIESRHFKLWLHSTAVLETIFRSKIINQSHFKMQDIRNLLKLYVVNPSFSQAEKILEKSRFVVISGIPGIGKSTLAYILAYTYLARKEYDEFIYISESIDEGYEQFKEGTRQVFLFDDFLGQSFEDRTLSRNEDRRIIDFIRQIHKSKDKILLFTTRKYILRDVQLKHELLNEPDFEFAKCLIDLSTYTKLIKAKILYNHLFFADLPATHRRAFALKKNYQEIISHPNYSPRIIETAIRQELSSPLTPAAFVKKIIQSLDNPFKVWEIPFTDQITDLSRWLLTIIFTIGTPVKLEDAREACEKFFACYGTRYFPQFSTAAFNKSLKELENSFLISDRDEYLTRTLRFQNPSIRDFLLHYYELNKDQLNPVIEAAIFQEQFFHVLRAYELKKSDRHASYMAKKIVCDKRLNQSIIHKILSEGDRLESADLSVFRSSTTRKDYYQSSGHGQYTLLQRFQSSYHNTEFQQEIDQYVLSRMKTMLSLPSDWRVNDNELVSYISLLKKYLSGLNCDPVRILQEVSDKLEWLHEYEYYFKKLETVFPKEYRDFIWEEDFSQKIYDIASNEMDNVDPENTEGLANSLKFMENEYHVDFKDEIAQLKKIETASPYPEEDEDHFAYQRERRNEEQQIDRIFSSFGDNI